MKLLYLCDGKMPCVRKKFDDDSSVICYVNRKNESSEDCCWHTTDIRYAKHKNLTSLDFDRFAVRPGSSYLWEIPPWTD